MRPPLSQQSKRIKDQIRLARWYRRERLHLHRELEELAERLSSEVESVLDLQQRIRSSARLERLETVKKSYERVRDSVRCSIDRVLSHIQKANAFLEKRLQEEKNLRDETI